MQAQINLQPRKNFKEGIIMKREQIDEKFKWDISSIYKTIEDYEKRSIDVYLQYNFNQIV